MTKTASVRLTRRGDTSIATLAIEAYRRFGKGRHPASLNLGDWFA